MTYERLGASIKKKTYLGMLFLLVLLIYAHPSIFSSLARNAIINIPCCLFPDHHLSWGFPHGFLTISPFPHEMIEQEMSTAPPLGAGIPSSA